jgi:hypothetical protein
MSYNDEVEHYGTINDHAEYFILHDGASVAASDVVCGKRHGGQNWRED